MMMGLLHSELNGPGNIGWESVLLIVTYLLGLSALIVG